MKKIIILAIICISLAATGLLHAFDMHHNHDFQVAADHHHDGHDDEDHNKDAPISDKQADLDTNDIQGHGHSHVHDHGALLTVADVETMTVTTVLLSGSHPNLLPSDFTEDNLRPPSQA